MAYGHRLVTGGLSVALVLATACGGSSGNNVGESNDGGTTSDGARGVDGGNDAAAPRDGSSGTDGASPVDGSNGGDSSLPASDGGAKGTIACGMGTTCTAPAQVCCAVAKAADAGGGSSSCVAAGTCNGVSISCEGTDNCAAGDKCCLSGGGQGSASATCEPKCNNGAQLCNKQADCPASERCRPVPELGGLGVCEAVPLDAAAD